MDAERPSETFIYIYIYIYIYTKIHGVTAHRIASSYSCRLATVKVACKIPHCRKCDTPPNKHFGSLELKIMAFFSEFTSK
jgi:hypothetical protein